MGRGFCIQEATQSHICAKQRNFDEKVVNLCELKASRNRGTITNIITDMIKKHIKKYPARQWAKK